MRLIDADELITAFPCGESIRTESVRATINHMPTTEVSEDAISREALIKRWDEMSVRGRTEFDQEIMVAPSVIPQPKEGEWKWETNDICHNCGYKIPHLERIVGETVLMDSKDWSFCPNCGAKRRGEDNV